MITLGIRYLNGFAAASDPDDRDAAEWPPHPGRIFMALTASHFQTDASASGRTALEWLEQQGSPQIHCSTGLSRDVVTQFVPVNPRIADENKAREKERTAGKKPPPALQSAPGIIRTRQPRTFARTWLEDDTIWLVWPEVEAPTAIREALSLLCSKVTRIGHSSSLVQMWVSDADAPQSPNWVPDDDRSVIRLRIATPGTLADLERRFNGAANESYAELLVVADDDSDKKEQKAARARLKADYENEPPPRHRPQLSVFQGYAAPLPLGETSASVRGSVLSPFFLPLTLERIDGPYRHLDLLNVLIFCQRLHEALCSHCDDLGTAVIAMISGRANGKPLDVPHLAFVPLAFVGHPHADGRLLGIGLAFPETITRQERRGVLTALERARKEGLKLGRLGSWRIEPITVQRPPVNLLPKTWTDQPEGATEWATVTPIAFDQHAKAKDKVAYRAEIAAMIRQACQRIGLPEPREVIVMSVSAHLGAPTAQEFPRLQRKDGSKRRHSHAILIFGEPVRGPILLGAGRYRGYGLCRPMREEG